MYEEAKSRQMFAGLLRSVRKGLELTQEEMASRLGVSRVRYNQYEMGHHLPKQPGPFLVSIEALVSERLLASRSSHSRKAGRRAFIQEKEEKHTVTHE